MPSSSARVHSLLSGVIAAGADVAPDGAAAGASAASSCLPREMHAEVARCCPGRAPVTASSTVADIVDVSQAVRRRRIAAEADLAMLRDVEAFLSRVSERRLVSSDDLSGAGADSASVSVTAQSPRPTASASLDAMPSLASGLNVAPPSSVPAAGEIAQVAEGQNV